jgi:hypothetical protein
LTLLDAAGFEVRSGFGCRFGITKDSRARSLAGDRIGSSEARELALGGVHDATGRETCPVRGPAGGAGLSDAHPQSRRLHVDSAQSIRRPLVGRPDQRVTPKPDLLLSEPCQLIEQLTLTHDRVELTWVH